MSKATEAVRGRLLAVVPPDRQALIQGVLAALSDKMLRKAAAPRDFSYAVALIDKMQGDRQLNEAAIAGFAEVGQYEELVVALARTCGTPVELIERLMQNLRYDGILVACKAAEFRFPTLQVILKTKYAPYEMPATDVAQARADFLKLSVATAQRMLRFWLVRGVAKIDA